jgi:leucine dehydrogenase
MRSEGHEEVVFVNDAPSGLRAIIAIHDTTLGPALGGTRMWNYAGEDDALNDVLRLSKAMTYKASLAGLDLGGGKGVILGDPHRDKTPDLFRAYGRAVNTLGGRYITAEDVGTTPEDLAQVMQETRWLVGKPPEVGGSGDSAPATGFGVYQGMRACAREAFGDASLAGRTVAIQGFGKVASNLAGYLKKEGARIIACDVFGPSAERAQREFGAEIVEPSRILDAACDILAPCALGGVLNKDTIPHLRCRVVCGGANNQLAEPADGDRLEQRGILYAPDYLVNAGGIINLSFEMTRYDPEAAMNKVAGIHDTMQRVIQLSKQRGLSTSRTADLLAEERVAQARRR